MTIAPLRPARNLAQVFDRALPDTTEPVLSLRNVGVRFQGIAAISDLDADVGHHDLVAIIGPNGAGKTTLLNAICGIVETTGSIAFNGHGICGLKPASIAAFGVGRSFQDPPLIDHYTVLENVLCGAHLRLTYGMADQVFRRRKVDAAEAEMQWRAHMLLDFVGLADRMHVEAGELPYGARKLVDIARAMIGGPQLLLLDEPSSGLDAQERKALEEILVTLRVEECVAILVVEHHMDLVRATASRVLALQAGQVLMTGTPSEVLDSDIFREALVGGSTDDDDLLTDSLD